VICVDDYENDVGNLCAALRKGIGEVISTIGIHESGATAAAVSSSGSARAAEIFHTEAFRRRRRRAGFASSTPIPTAATSLTGTKKRSQARQFRFYPKVYKAGSQQPTDRDLRGVLTEGGSWRRRARSRCAHHGLRKEPDRDPVDPSMGRSVGHHDTRVISSMSFGSQSEPAFRAICPRRQGINILCSTEGGDPDMYGKFRKWRGQQVASGRFVSPPNAQLLVRRRDQDRPGAKPARAAPARQKVSGRWPRPERHARHGLICPRTTTTCTRSGPGELIDELKRSTPTCASR